MFSEGQASGEDAAPGDPITIHLVEPTRWFLVSPWNHIVFVRPFTIKSDNFVAIYLAAKGALDTLKDARVVSALAARVDRHQAPQSVDAQDGRHAASLAQEAQAAGFTPRQLDQAIRDWAKAAASPRERTIAAIFLGDYAEAIRQIHVLSNEKSRT